MTIAITSGFFNTAVRLASQQSIKSMMETWIQIAAGKLLSILGCRKTQEQHLTAHVLRDGQVVEAWKSGKKSLAD